MKHASRSAVVALMLFPALAGVHKDAIAQTYPLKQIRFVVCRIRQAVRWISCHGGWACR
jgi:hypothetical protein